MHLGLVFILGPCYITAKLLERVRLKLKSYIPLPLRLNYIGLFSSPTFVAFVNYFLLYFRICIKNEIMNVTVNKQTTRENRMIRFKLRSLVFYRRNSLPLYAGEVFLRPNHFTY